MNTIVFFMLIFMLPFEAQAGFQRGPVTDTPRYWVSVSDDATPDAPPISISLGFSDA